MYWIIGILVAIGLSITGVYYLCKNAPEGYEDPVLGFIQTTSNNSLATTQLSANM
jgi:hypothetical protein